MKSPVVVSVQALENHTLLVEFSNREKKLYDVNPLLRRDLFAPLRELALFKAVSVEPGGYAVAWGSDIDIREHELWTNGRSA